MSVIVEGFHKPKNCFYCPFNKSNCFCVLTDGGYINRDDWSCSATCPIKELPKGHGRIADMDEAIKCIKEAEGDDAIWAIALIEWACGKRTLIEADKMESEVPNGRKDKKEGVN